MGIPKFASWLLRKVPRALATSSPEVSTLCIDLNGVIHPLTHSEDDPSIAAQPEAVKFARIGEHIARLISLVRPKDAVFVAIDGVAPRAKCAQQRVRRYMGAIVDNGASQSYGLAPPDDVGTSEGEAAEAAIADTRARLERGIYEMGETEVQPQAAEDSPQQIPRSPSDDAFDSNCITPGTEFMDRLRDSLEKYFATQVEKWGINIIFSDSTVPGEGEHKLIAFLRGMGRGLEGSHVIVGQDADLLLLGMALHLPSVYIMRDSRGGRFSYGEGIMSEVSPATEGSVEGKPQRTGMRSKRYDLVDMRRISEGLLEEVAYLVDKCGVSCIETGTHTPRYVANSSQVLNDIITLVAVVGNDFLPRLPSAYAGDYAMDNVLEVYVRHVLPHGYLTTPQGEVQADLLHRWLLGYARVERALLRLGAAKCGRMAFDTPATVEEGDARWRTLYYSTTTLHRSVVPAAARAWVRGLRFVAAYYLAGKPAWEWQYPFHYAPFAEDIAAFLTSPEGKDEGEAWRGGEPVSAWVQLACVLPPTSAGLLPSALRTLLTSPPPSFRASVPTTWEVDYSGSDGKAHLATARLPFADVTAAVEAVAKLGVGDECVERKLTHGKWTLIFRPTEVRRLTGLPPVEVPIDERGSMVLERVDFSKLPQSVGRRRYRLGTAGDNRRGESDAAEGAKGTSAMRRWNHAGPRGVALADFAWAVGLAAAVTATTWHSALQAVFTSVTVVLLYLLLGIGLTHPISGSGIMRHVRKDAHVDWLCSQCGLLNFGRNATCFVCGMGFNNLQCWAVVHRKGQGTPPLYDTDHSPHVVTVRLPGVAAVPQDSDDMM